MQERLEGRADAVVARIEEQLDQYVATSRAIAALRETADDLASWERDVERLEVGADLPAVLSIGSTTLVTPAGLDAYEATTRPTVGGEFAVRPPLADRTEQPERLLVIDRVAPVEPNRPALGLDVLTNPDAAVGASRAILERRPGLSDALSLAQDPDGPAGLVLYTPWYDEAGRIGGATNLVWRGQELLDALAPELGGLGVRVTDETGSGERLVATHGPTDDGAVVVRSATAIDQEWSVAVVAPPGFASRMEQLAGWLTFLGLAALTIAVAALVDQSRRREEHARAEVAERTSELVAANEELHEALGAKDDLLALVGHEFRTPLTVIRGFAMTATAGRGGDVPPDVVAMLDRISTHAARLDRLLDDLLVAARLRTGTHVVNPEPVAVRWLVDAAARRLGGELDDLEVDVVGAPVLDADPEDATRALAAVLGNAVKYGAEPVVVSAWTEDELVVVRVRDHGPGIPEDQREAVFEPFGQGDHGDRRESTGIGLGLANVRELCRRNGGSARVVPVQGPGACVELRLPLATLPVTPATAR